MPLRVLLVSDHDGVRESLHALLAAQFDLCVVTAPTTEEDCLREALACLPDVAIIVGGSAVTAERLVATLHRAHPDTAIIVLAMQAD
jgi:DNA-binding NarL/FixJ family response regulator